MERGRAQRGAVRPSGPDGGLHDRRSIAGFVAIGLLIGIGNLGRAAEPSTASAQRVYVGVYVKQIHGISLKDSLATVDFHVWFRWTGDGLKPLESFDLVNGRVESKQSVYETKIGGVNYASCTVVASLHKLWDISRYPLDSHTLTIEIEDNNLEADKLVYLPDVENSGMSNHVEVAGWTLKPGKAEILTSTDLTNYGDISLPTGHESSWSRFVFSIEVCASGEPHLQSGVNPRDDTSVGASGPVREITPCLESAPSIYAGTPSSTISAGAA